MNLQNYLQQQQETTELKQEDSFQEQNSMDQSINSQKSIDKFKKQSVPDYIKVNIDKIKTLFLPYWEIMISFIQIKFGKKYTYSYKVGQIYIKYLLNTDNKNLIPKIALQYQKIRGQWDLLKEDFELDTNIEEILLEKGRLCFDLISKQQLMEEKIMQEKLRKEESKNQIKEEDSDTSQQELTEDQVLEEWIMSKDIPQFSKIKQDTDNRLSVEFFKHPENIEFFLSFIFNPQLFDCSIEWRKRYLDIIDCDHFKAQDPIFLKQMLQRNQQEQQSKSDIINGPTDNQIEIYNLRSFKALLMLTDSRNHKMLIKVNQSYMDVMFSYMYKCFNEYSLGQNINHIVYLLEFLISKDQDTVIYYLLHNNLLYRLMMFFQFNQVKHFFSTISLMEGCFSVLNDKSHEIIWKYFKETNFLIDLSYMMLYASNNTVPEGKMKFNFKPNIVRQQVLPEAALRNFQPLNNREFQILKPGEIIEDLLGLHCDIDQIKHTSKKTERKKSIVQAQKVFGKIQRMKTLGITFEHGNSFTSPNNSIQKSINISKDKQNNTSNSNSNSISNYSSNNNNKKHSSNDILSFKQNNHLLKKSQTDNYNSNFKYSIQSEQQRLSGLEQGTETSRSIEQTNRSQEDIFDESEEQQYTEMEKKHDLLHRANPSFQFNSFSKNSEKGNNKNQNSIKSIQEIQESNSQNQLSSTQSIQNKKSSYKLSLNNLEKVQQQYSKSTIQSPISGNKMDVNTFRSEINVNQSQFFNQTFKLPPLILQDTSLYSTFGFPSTKKQQNFDQKNSFYSATVSPRLSQNSSFQKQDIFQDQKKKQSNIMGQSKQINIKNNNTNKKLESQKSSKNIVRIKKMPSNSNVQQNNNLMNQSNFPAFKDNNINNNNLNNSNYNNNIDNQKNQSFNHNHRRTQSNQPQVFNSQLIGEDNGFKIKLEVEKMKSLYPLSLNQMNHTMIDHKAKNPEFQIDRIQKNEHYSNNCAQFLLNLVQDIIEKEQLSKMQRLLGIEKQIQERLIIGSIFAEKGIIFDNIIKNYLFKIKISQYEDDNSGYVCGKIVNLILQNLKNNLFLPYLDSIHQIIEVHYDYLQKTIIRSFSWKKENQAEQQIHLQHIDLPDHISISQITLVKTLLHFYKNLEQKQLQTYINNKTISTCWHVIVMFLFVNRTNSIYHNLFMELIKIILGNGNAQVWNIILFKLRTIHYFHLAFSEIINNNVSMNTYLHMDSMFLTIDSFFFFLLQTLNQRASELGNIKLQLEQLEIWKKLQRHCSNFGDLCKKMERQQILDQCLKREQDSEKQKQSTQQKKLNINVQQAYDNTPKATSQSSSKNSPFNQLKGLKTPNNVKSNNLINNNNNLPSKFSNKK